MRTHLPRPALLECLEVCCTAVPHLLIQLSHSGCRYQTDKWLLTQLELGQLLDPQCTNKACKAAIKPGNHFCTSCGNRHSLCTFNIIGRCPICGLGTNNALASHGPHSVTAADQQEYATYVDDDFASAICANKDRADQGRSDLRDDPDVGNNPGSGDGIYDDADFTDADALLPNNPGSGDGIYDDADFTDADALLPGRNKDGMHNDDDIGGRINNDDWMYDDGDFDDTVPISASRAQDDLEESNDFQTRMARATQSPFTVAAFALWYFLSESREQAKPDQYGKRLPFRRIFLLLAVACVGAVVLKSWFKDLEQSPIDEVKELLKAQDPDLVWPRNGTVFDNLFELYAEARYASDVLSIIGWIAFLLAMVIEPVLDSTMAPGRGIKASRVLGGVGMVFLWVSMVLPAAPNYLRALHYNEIVAFCAPEFNRFVDKLVGNIVGLVCSSFFAITLLMMLLAVCPALVRVSKMMFLDSRIVKWGKYRHSPIELLVYKRNLLVTMAWSSLLAPLLCCLPMLIFYQFFGDKVVGIVFICFAILPIIAAFAASKRRLKLSYYLYLLFYFGPLLVSAPAHVNKDPRRRGEASSSTLCYGFVFAV